MDETWEKAVEAVLGGQVDSSSAEPLRALTLDGAVKCLHGRLPPPALFEKFPALEHLSIANVRLMSLEGFPRLPALQRLILSDNRISGGLEFLVEAGLNALHDLDLSNNRILSLDDLAPLARLHLVSLDLYKCPVTKIRNYRSRVFGSIPSLKYLDKMDADGNERPESDEEEDEEEYEDDEEEEEVVNGSKMGQGKVSNGVQGEEDGDEEEEDDIEIDEEERDEEVVVEDREEEDVKEGEGGEIAENGRGEDDEDGEIEDLEYEDDEEEDVGIGYVVQPIAQPKDLTEGCEFDVDNGEDEGEGVDDEQDHCSNGAHSDQSSSLQPNKRKRDGGDDTRSPNHC